MLTSIKNYRPYSSHGAVKNESFSESWAQDPSVGRSAASIYELIVGMGKISRVLVVDGQYGQDYTSLPPRLYGERESWHRPFKSLTAGLDAMQQGDTMLIMPGEYSIQNFLGIMPKENTTFILVNATLTYQGSYSPVFVYPNSAKGVRFIGIGNSRIRKLTQTGWGGILTPYTGPVEIWFENLYLESPEQVCASLGGAGSSERDIHFFNCRIEQTDSTVNPAIGGGSIDSSVYFRDSRIRGYFYFNGSSASRPSYSLRVERCIWESIQNPTNGKWTCIDMGEYFSNPVVSRLVLEDSLFRSGSHILETGLGYGGYGANKSVHSSRCSFVSSNFWIENNHPSMEFFLRSNHSNQPEGGLYPLINQYSGAGVEVEPTLDFFY
jgi:hypothetical protein